MTGHYHKLCIVNVQTLLHESYSTYIVIKFCISNLASKCKIYYSGIQFNYLITTLQHHVQPCNHQAKLYNLYTTLQGCVHLARDDHKLVCTLERLMQGCHKVAAT